MKWVYTDQAEIPHNEAFLIELVKAAKKYRLKELKERYNETFMLLQISVKNHNKFNNILKISENLFNTFQDENEW